MTMAAYADFTYYQNTYGGTAVASSAYGPLSLRASAIIDYITHDRAAEIVTAAIDTALINKIKMAMCAVLEQYYTSKLQQDRMMTPGGAVKSESVGSLSVTYYDPRLPGSSTKDTAGYYASFIETAKVYLGSSGLLFAGFYNGELGGLVEEL